PTETIQRFWSVGSQSQDLGPRSKEILARVRSWLRGAEQSAEDDRRTIELLFAHCAVQPELHEWSQLSPPECEQVFNKLLRIVAGLSATIRNQRPRTKNELEFRIDWRNDGDGLGSWEVTPPTNQFSLKGAIHDLVGLYGQLVPAQRMPVAMQIMVDL